MPGLRRQEISSAQSIVGVRCYTEMVRVSATVFAVAHAAQGQVGLAEEPRQGAAPALKAMVHGVHWRRGALFR